MSRFDEPRPEKRVYTHCVYCGSELVVGFDVVKYDGEFYCDMDCFKDHNDVVEGPLEFEDL
jgi:hypothetical protein